LKYTFRFGDKFVEPDDDCLKCIEKTSDELLGAYSKSKDNALSAAFGSCRCFGSDRTPGVAPQGVFRSRTVSTTVAKRFVPIARGTVDKVYRFGPLRDA
jgi:hypothetical protein